MTVLGEVEAQVDGLDAVIRQMQIEHRAPAIELPERPCRGDLDLAARGGDDRDDIRMFAQQIEVAAREIDHEAPGEIGALLADDAADAGARGVRRGEPRGDRIGAAPVQLVAEQQFLALLGLLCRIPERHDIVEGLIECRNLHQHHLARTPVTTWLDPHRRALLVEHTIVFVLAEGAFALHEAESTRIVVDKTVGAQHRRIHQRPPDPLPGPGPYLQAVGIVNLRAPVIGRTPVILAKQIHAGAGRDPDPVHLLARIQRGIDIHDERIADLDHEPIGAADAR